MHLYSLRFLFNTLCLLKNEFFSKVIRTILNSEAYFHFTSFTNFKVKRQGEKIR